MWKREVCIILFILFSINVNAFSLDFEVSVRENEAKLDLNVFDTINEKFFATIIVERDGLEISRKQANLDTNNLYLSEILFLEPGEYYATAIVDNNGKELVSEKSFFINSTRKKGISLQSPLNADYGAWLPILFVLFLIVLISVIATSINVARFRK